MKKLIIISTIFLFALSFAQAQDQAFEKLAETKGVSVVHISRSMLQMMPSVRAKGIDIGGLAGKLNSITILSGETTKSSETIRKEVNSIVKKGSYEQTMFMKDDNSKTVFYMKKGKNNDNEILMLSDNGSEISLIRIVGDVSPQDIQSVGEKSDIWENSRRQKEDAQKQRDSFARQKEIEEARKRAREQHERTMKSSEQQREQAQKQREQALKNAEQAREQAQRTREQALKNAEREREQALKEGERAREEGRKAREQAQREAERARKEGERAVLEAQKQIEEARKLIDKQIEEVKKNSEYHYNFE